MTLPSLGGHQLHFFFFSFPEWGFGSPSGEITRRFQNNSRHLLLYSLRVYNCLLGVGMFYLIFSLLLEAKEIDGRLEINQPFKAFVLNLARVEF